MKSLKKLNLKNKRVVIRLDLDVPIENKKIKDDTRLKESLPTLKLLKKAKQVVIIGHLGRPKGTDLSLSLKPVAKRLSKLMNVNINFQSEGKYIMLENLRFNPGEKANNAKFAKRLASYGDVFVNDAFAVSHRKAASTVGITKYLPSYPGLNLEKEYKNIKVFLKKPKKPLILILGGKKIDKLTILKDLVKKADAVLIGGAMMFSFLKAMNYEVGKSKTDNIKLAKNLLSRKILLPIDVVLDNKKNVYVEKIPKTRKGYDIGEETILIYEQIIKNAGTIIWNGPMGYFEKGFNKGNRRIAKAVAESKAKSLVGGGDTSYSVKNHDFTYSTTAGGAFLQLISGKKLPAVEALK